MFNKYFLPPDVFFRHSVIARAVGNSKEILDVGGSLGELRKFLPHAHITTADVIEGADILFKGKKLPIDSKFYETVVSVDTLEHVPQKERASFVKELCRVARKRVILLAPYGSTEHTKIELQLAETYKREKREVPNYLKEHIKFGLPGEEFLQSLRQEINAQTNLCGLLWFDRINFLIHTFEVKNGKLNQLLYRTKFFWNLFANLFITPFLLWVSVPISAASRFLVRIKEE